MKPYYESWKSSAHSDVKCIACHYAPGLKNKLRGRMEGLVQLVNYVSKAYRRSKPWAEIPDESCLRSGCHDTQLLNGQEEFKGVHFSHAPHLTELRRGKTLRCTSCHSQIVQGEHILVTESTCFICHFKENSDGHEALGECRICHTDERMLIASEQKSIRYDHTDAVERDMECLQCHSQTVIGDGAVPREQCYHCHMENSRLARVGETDFLHETHIAEHKIECIQCHLPIKHLIDHRDVDALAECKTCHSGAHSEQIDLFLGRGGVGLEDMPSSMLGSGMNCKGCHLFHSMGKRGGSTESLLGKPESCEKCHGKGFGRLMQQWQKISEKKIDRLEQLYKRVTQEVSRMGKGNVAEESIRAARFNIDLVKRGKSVHNMNYADALLNVAYDRLVEGLKGAGSSLKLPGFGETTTVIPSQCASCHVSLQVDDVSVFGVAFSHERHVIDHDTQCQKCHSHAMRHGELIISRQQCLDCHHQNPETKKCQDCHEVAYAFYSGTSFLLEGESPDIMFEAELECYSCHTDDEGKIIRATGTGCVNCHEEGYNDLLGEWQEGSKTALETIDGMLQTMDNIALDTVQKAQLETIENIVNVVKEDGSMGAHNYATIEALLSDARTKLERLK